MILGSLLLLYKVYGSKFFNINTSKYLNLLIFLSFAISTFIHLLGICSSHMSPNNRKTPDTDHDIKLTTDSLWFWDGFISFQLNDEYHNGLFGLSAVSTIYRISIGAEINEKSIFKSNTYRIKNVISASFVIAIINFIHYLNEIFFNFDKQQGIIRLIKNIIYMQIYLLLACWFIYILYHFGLRKKTNFSILYREYPKITLLILITLCIIIICSLQYFSFVIYTSIIFIIVYDSQLF